MAAQAPGPSDGACDVGLQVQGRGAGAGRRRGVGKKRGEGVGKCMRRYMVQAPGPSDGACDVGLQVQGRGKRCRCREMKGGGKEEM